MRVNRLSSVLLRIVVVLVCLVLFSAHLASGMFARYTVSGSETNSVRVAKYGVKVVALDQGDPIRVVDPNGNVSYRFKVDNSTSEVAVKYSIRIAFSDIYNGDTKVADVEDMYRDVKLNGFAPTGIVNQDNADSTYIYVFELGDTLEPNTESAEYTLTFNTYPGWKSTLDDTLPEDTVIINNTDKYPVRIFVDAEQIG